MLSIRLSRTGKPKKATYRILVMEKAKDPYAKYLENLGTYNPHTKETVINSERINYWISRGAQPSPTVHNLLIEKKVIEGEKVSASKSKPGKKKQEAAESKKGESKDETGSNKSDDAKKESGDESGINLSAGKAENQESSEKKPEEIKKEELKPE